MPKSNSILLRTKSKLVVRQYSFCSHWTVLRDAAKSGNIEEFQCRQEQTLHGGHYQWDTEIDNFMQRSDKIVITSTQLICREGLCLTPIQRHVNTVCKVIDSQRSHLPYTPTDILQLLLCMASERTLKRVGLLARQTAKLYLSYIACWKLWIYFQQCICPRQEHEPCTHTYLVLILVTSSNN